MALDNLHRLPQWASDDLCRAITGGGFAKRVLYTDDDDFLYDFNRAVILNGISIPGSSPDLLDRSILIELSRLPEDRRRDREALMSEFEAARPRILGAICSVLSDAMARIGSIKLDRLPRMADWTGGAVHLPTRWVSAKPHSWRHTAITGAFKTVRYWRAVLLRLP